MAIDTNDGRSFGTLLRELAEQGAALVRSEARLAKIEIAQTLRSVGAGTGMVAAGTVFALIGGLALLVGLVLLAGDQWLSDNFWLAALIVTLIAGGVAAWMAKHGLDLLEPHKLAPDQTVATLKEDKEWLKRQLT